MGNFKERTNKTKDYTCNKTGFDDGSQIHGLWLRNKFNLFLRDAKDRLTKISFLQCAPVVQLSCSSDDKNITKHHDEQQHYISL
jgi:hypothetical protein